MRDELRLCFGLGLAATAVVASFMLMHAEAVALLVAMMTMVDVWLCGGLPLWGVRLNAVSFICLVMAIGLVVDYLAHFVHYYLKQDQRLDPAQKLGATMGEIGPAVSLGVLTTLLGTLPLACSSAEIFRYFFRIFLCIIVFSAAHAFILGPALLYLSDPSPGSPYAVLGRAESPQSGQPAERTPKEEARWGRGSP
jgi:predicted RND superfamily exporter protein